MDDFDKLKAQKDEMVRLERVRLGAEITAYLETGVRGTGKPTDIYPDWVYEAREAIRHMRDNPPPWLDDLLRILGWQGGTIHRALRAVSRLVESEKDREERRKRREALGLSVPADLVGEPDGANYANAKQTEGP